MTSRSSFFYYAGTKVLGRSEYASESGLEGRPICVSKLKKGPGTVKAVIETAFIVPPLGIEPKFKV